MVTFSVGNGRFGQSMLLGLEFRGGNARLQLGGSLDCLQAACIWVRALNTRKRSPRANSTSMHHSLPQCNHNRRVGSLDETCNILHVADRGIDLPSTLEPNHWQSQRWIPSEKPTGTYGWHLNEHERPPLLEHQRRPGLLSCCGATQRGCIIAWRNA